MNKAALVVVQDLFVVACGGGGGTTATGAGGGSGSGGSLFGTWSGTVQSTVESAKKAMDAEFVVNEGSGSSFSAVFTVSRSLCIPGGDISGSRNGSQFSFNGRNPFRGRFTVTRTISGRSISASYTSRGSFSCSGTTDEGSINPNKILHQPVDQSVEVVGVSSGTAPHRPKFRVELKKRHIH